jgi:hypothetical protein
VVGVNCGVQPCMPSKRVASSHSPFEITPSMVGVVPGYDRSVLGHSPATAVAAQTAMSEARMGRQLRGRIIGFAS